MCTYLFAIDDKGYIAIEAEVHKSIGARVYVICTAYHTCKAWNLKTFQPRLLQRAENTSYSNLQKLAYVVVKRNQAFIKFVYTLCL